MNIKLLTYNICWECSEGQKSKSINGTTCLINKKNICLKNIINLILTNQKKYNLDFILLQEEKNFDKYLKSLTNYTFHKSISSSDKIITFWNKDKWMCKGKYDSEFGIGRAFHILFLKNKITKETIILCNVHPGHYKEDNITNFKKIMKSLSFTSEEKQILKKNLIILAGDYNNENPIKNGELNKINLFNNRKFYNESKKKTSVINLKKFKNRGSYIIDHVLSTNKKTEMKVIKTDNEWYSDHYPLLGIINF